MDSVLYCSIINFSTSKRYNTLCYAIPNSGISRNKEKNKEKKKRKILGHNFISNAITMTERSLEKSTHVNFDDLKAACAILMTVDTKIS